MVQSSSAVRVRKPRNRYHHGDLRRALLQEAVRTIAEDGVEHLTLREAGTRLGVSRTALYRHFSDKASLLAAVARDGFQRFHDDLQRAWATAPGSRRGFDRMGEAYVQFAVANPAHYRVMFGDFRHLCGKDPELAADAQQAFRVLTDAVATLQHGGLMAAGDTRQVAEFIWAVVHGLAMLTINGQLGPDPVASGRLQTVAQVVSERIWSGVEADAASARS